MCEGTTPRVTLPDDSASEDSPRDGAKRPFSPNQGVPEKSKHTLLYLSPQI